MIYKWIPIIHRNRCTGCAQCVDVCASKCLVMLEGEAVLAHPELCGSEGRCAARCEDDAIHMGWLPILGKRMHGTRVKSSSSFFLKSKPRTKGSRGE